MVLGLVSGKKYTLLKLRGINNEITKKTTIKTKNKQNKQTNKLQE